MRIKIVSDGTSRNTHVTDAETGEKINGIKSITIKGMAGKNFTASLEFNDIEFSIEADAGDKEPGGDHCEPSQNTETSQ